MHDYVARNCLPQIIKRLANNPAVALLGPRQVGKSTLAKHICEHQSGALYLDLERDKDRNKLSNLEAFFEINHDRFICLDEIQRTPEIFPFIRGYLDRQQRAGQLLVLGSASRDLIRQSSESLAGRISYLEITPFQLSEVADDFNRLWLRGGFPRSYLAADDTVSFDWRLDYISTFLERDIPQLGFNIPPTTLHRFWRMLAHVHGQTLNASKLGESLGVSSHTIRSYLDILQQTFIIRVLPPFAENVKKRLIKSPKVYIRDSGLMHALLDIETINDLLGHPNYGSSFEGIIIESILTALPRWQAFFYRTSNQAEIDLVLRKGQMTLAIEIKASASPKVSRGFYQALNDIQADKAIVIAQIEDSYPLKDNITAMNIMAFLQSYA